MIRPVAQAQQDTPHRRGRVAAQGVDTTWLQGQYHLFASFRRRGSMFKAAMLLLKLVCGVLYVGLMDYPRTQGTGCGVQPSVQRASLLSIFRRHTKVAS